MEMADRAKGVTLLHSLPSLISPRGQEWRQCLWLKDSHWKQYPFRLLQIDLQHYVPSMYFINRFIKTMDICG